MSDRIMTNEEAAAILESEAEFLYAQDEPYSRQAFNMAIEALRHQYITQACIKVEFSEEDKRQIIEEIVENLKHGKVTCIPNEYAQDAKTCGKCACYDRQFGYCNKLGVTFADDDFCSCFEQKEETENDR